MNANLEELNESRHIDIANALANTIANNITIAIEYERQRQENAAILKTMEVLKEALEKISNLSTGESSWIACEALDSIYLTKGDTK